MKKRRSYKYNILASVVAALCLYQSANVLSSAGVLNAQLLRKPMLNDDTGVQKVDHPIPMKRMEFLKPAASVEQSTVTESPSQEVVKEKQFNAGMKTPQLRPTEADTPRPPMCGRIKEIVKVMMKMAEDCDAGK